VAGSPQTVAVPVPFAMDASCKSAWFSPMLRILPVFVWQCHDERFCSCHIFFTNRTGFRRNCTLHFHNRHICSDINPLSTVQCRWQQEFSINVWAGIVGDCCLKHSLELLNNTSGAHFTEILDTVLLDIQWNMWLMCDGAPAHFSYTAWNYLEAAHTGWWIGR
jgi:hypothetical protein